MRIFTEFRTLTIELLLREHERWVLWLPVGLALGIGIYFSLPAEPPLWLGPVGVIFSLLIGRVLWRRGLAGRFAALAVVLGFTGFATGEFETWRMRSPSLKAATKVVEVQGHVLEKQVMAEGAKLLLEPTIIENVENPPRRIRISFKKTSLPGVDTGDSVRFRAGLYPPPGPVMPGSFDFSRYFYFQGIGAVGFGMPAVEVMHEGDASGWREWLTDARHWLTAHIGEQIVSPLGPIAAALITGETSAIPEDVNEIMRKAGLAHLLAVSGMNLAIVAGTLFFLCRFVLAAIPPLAGRWNIKKWSALVALMGSAAYLAICGAPVSAQRAFLMTLLLLSAVLLDRVVTPARSIAWAAIIVLLLFPHSLLEPGFQLSFAATLALIAGFENIQPRLMAALGTRRVLFYIAGVFLTSLSAGLATMPYTLYHFSDFSTYSLLANVLAAPLVTFWIMPAAVLGLIALPLGLDGVFFWFMKWGIAVMLGMAQWVAALPESFLHPAPISTFGLVLVTLGGLWLLLWQHVWRWAGFALIALGLCTAFLHRSPDVFIAEDGKRIVVRLEDGRMVALKGRSQSFGMEEWLRAGRQEEILRRSQIKDNSIRCDMLGCVFGVHGQRVAFTQRYEGLEEDCLLAQAVVFAEGYKDTSCRAPLFDRGDLNREGSIIMWVGKDFRWQGARQLQGRRPWVKNYGEAGPGSAEEMK